MGKEREKNYFADSQRKSLNPSAQTPTLPPVPAQCDRGCATGRCEHTCTEEQPLLTGSTSTLTPSTHCSPPTAQTSHPLGITVCQQGQGGDQGTQGILCPKTLPSASPGATSLPASRPSQPSPLCPNALLTNAALTFGRGQLCSDVHVAQVSLAALHGLVGGWRSFAGHFPLLIDLEAALLVNLGPVVNAEGSKAALALAPIPIPTGDALTHTFVGNHLQLPLLVCKREKPRKKHHPVLNSFT